ncbi:STAS domain-containing protein [Magnetospirillum sp. UT-4]|uniref:STAS domain-containing protein n=1 Tax=Magnetospirillum sp. UT-4 TaxID=2681467 RepID=UPI0013855A55|nr:STAS domain-containing protein [Magnetospirillum sp. UT-4]CAA7618174.1 conserved hypothetical protein [Magnetospirillum sp. UT-4]
MKINDDNGRLVIDLPAVLDLPVASELRDLLLDLASRDTAAEIAVGGAGVERASTAAIQVLLAGAQALKAASRRLELEAPSEPLITAFRHLGLANDLNRMITA